MRPINNVVDVTNYVMLEIGQPMHAFDLERLAGQANRRAARARRTRRCARSTASIGRSTPRCSSSPTPSAPSAVGGVMGGADSEVSAATTTIALESAYFEPTSVRRTSRRLGLKTEASTRFERGSDIELPPKGIARAAELFAADRRRRAAGRR